MNIPELIDETTVCRILGGEQSPIHRSTLWRGINSGRFPKPIKIGGTGTNRWRREEVAAVIDKAVAERDQVAA